MTFNLHEHVESLVERWTRIREEFAAACGVTPENAHRFRWVRRLDYRFANVFELVGPDGERYILKEWDCFSLGQ